MGQDARKEQLALKAAGEESAVFGLLSPQSEIMG